MNQMNKLSNNNVIIFQTKYIKIYHKNKSGNIIKISMI